MKKLFLIIGTFLLISLAGCIKRPVEDIEIVFPIVVAKTDKIAFQINYIIIPRHAFDHSVDWEVDNEDVEILEKCYLLFKEIGEVNLVGSASNDTGKKDRLEVTNSLLIEITDHFEVKKDSTIYFKIISELEYVVVLSGTNIKQTNLNSISFNETGEFIYLINVIENGEEVFFESLKFIVE